MCARRAVSPNRRYFRKSRRLSEFICFLPPRTVLSFALASFTTSAICPKLSYINTSGLRRHRIRGEF